MEITPMSETEKAQAIHRMVKSGRELTDEQRLALLRLNQRFDQLWARRERLAGRQVSDPAERSARHEGR
ncbi:MAG TPA: hypothetical protein VNL77_19225 [Roseiflexaceae bacterium]|nr:hypothetical protein [Roseiflexaceae bacterium]